MTKIFPHTLSLVALTFLLAGCGNSDDGAVAALQEQLDGLNDLVTTLQGELDQAEAQIGFLEGDAARIDALEAAVSELEAAVTELESESASLRTDLDADAARIDVLEAAVTPTGIGQRSLED
jgi:uncharacterized coiled-coil protein SlyX